MMWIGCNVIAGLTRNLFVFWGLRVKPAMTLGNVLIKIVQIRLPNRNTLVINNDNISLDAFYLINCHDVRFVNAAKFIGRQLFFDLREREYCT